ncbi:S-DNA-T family DNA segregation ATPase FtsK/SpoIIIE [Halopolyspora algeriensis]|uniref:S-DNA-T family DNA segregation ATPase FtsK/SpoIIIE n=1 Tax=Halopolyspora algeriensis TaxID=1500506 RepID=A0A368VZI3_9ACTN|nr:FtsK/SpoIIIE domain-containing protein [Halopolyspora algeriensis]RCW46839.1 S-DNA-T family DNA segregation ATPase FtsK/SpoIIIE [Halopolyspora algeriensis]TQM47930.1 S-DNA-T family DNA segregation ATPase FtsK/SpoIIIE [Halopolyspora algeriensis]
MINQHSEHHDHEYDDHRDEQRAEPGEHARVYEFPSKREDSTQDKTDYERNGGTAESAERDTAGEVLEGELVDEDEQNITSQVDPPESGRGPSFWERLNQAERRAILPTWLSSRNQLSQAAKWAGGHYAHAAGYHAARCPVYAAKLASQAPRGTARIISGTARWVFDAEGQPLRSAAARREDAAEYLRLTTQRDARVRTRLALTLPVLLGGLPLTVFLVTGLPMLLTGAVMAGLVLALGAAGGHRDKPVVPGRAVVSTQVAKLTSDIVERALASLGIAEINKVMGPRGSGIAFPKPITRDGPGWRADIDLPHGVTVPDIVERREKLASGLRRPLGCVWPESDGTEHAGRLVLWVGDQDMAQAKQPAWPLLKKGTADLFQPVPFGTDQRGRPVAITLMYANLLIGAMPGVGKTFALRVLLLAAALDARAEMRIFELKGTGDLESLEKVAHHYGSGPDDGTVEATLESLREVYQDLEKRAATITRLARENKALVPENKVTPELAARSDLGLHPLVVAVDECQELFSHPEFGKEAGELATAIIKRGRALGVILILATQRPDKDSLPTGVSANVGIRFCLRVMGQMENDMVLGTSMYKNGVRASTFTAKDKGIGYLVGNADDPQIARSAYVDNPAADAITDRARAARHAAGTLSGHALGQTTTDRKPDTLPEDLLSLLGPDEDKVWTETAATRLAQTWPETYGSYTADQLTAALKPHGIKTNRQVWGTDEHGHGRNRRGFHRADLAKIVAERNRKREAG